MGRGQLIAGILADALAGAMGRPGQFAQTLEREKANQDEQVQWGLRRRQQLEDAIALKDYERQHPDLSPMERDAQAWANMTQPERDAYMQVEKARQPDTDVTVTLPNGQFYAGPRSGLAQALMGYQQPQTGLPPIGTVVPDPRKAGGPTQPASGGFPRRY
jgi:hypothetical protein